MLQVRRGDVLVTEGGDWDKVGRAAIWNGKVDACIHQFHLSRVRTSDENSGLL